jgi:cyclase
LIVVNASKDKKKIEEFAKILEGIVEDVFIPIAAGGGIRDIDDAKLLFNSGADKLILNSLLYTRPDLVKNLVQQYGSQSLVASIDYRKLNGNIAVFINDGTKKIDMNIEDYLKYVENLDIGEIYLNSIDRDGTGFGYDFDTIDNHTNQLKKPLIIAGGAGNADHLIQGLKREKVDAVATANLFNFIGDGLVNAREEIISKNLNIAKWAKR